MKAVLKKAAQEAAQEAHTWPALGGSVIGPHAAIRAATYHRDRATSPLLRGYWESVIARLQETVVCQ